MYKAALNHLLDTIDFDEYDYMSEEEKEKYCKLQNSIGRIDFCACGKHIEGAKEIVVTSEQQSVTKK